MGKNLVVCCDGTNNEVQGNLSNVLKLYRLLVKDARQRVYYNPGIGTIAHRDAWTRLKQDARSVFGLATGYGLDNDILGAYAFLADAYEDGDSIYLFGFSRGAYTVRALAGLIYVIGLLPRDQRNLATYALTAYKRVAETDDLKAAFGFGRIAGARAVPIRFVGAWDTVSSVIVPRKDRVVPTLLKLPYTRSNPGVQTFRHAMAIDERRRMFRLNRWDAGQTFKPDRFNEATHVPQDCKQVWFAGVHSDVGGGYPEAESGLAKFPLAWMVREAESHGVLVQHSMARHLVHGHALPGGQRMYVAPDASADQHDSMNAGWRLLEYLPKRVRWREWDRRQFVGWYLPKAEPRMIDDPQARPLVHASAVQRRQTPGLGYDPENFPANYIVEN
ncbi:MAG TPA: DUF2235 domain-containing protein [Tahibacter sp.]|nr:DUF2235 domain-containing protein [Tahibacter sp.]